VPDEEPPSTVEDLEGGRCRLQVGINELWIAYYAVGGDATVAQLQSWLAGEAVLPVRDHNYLAQALNDLRIDRGAGQPIGYRATPDEGTTDLA
jgi:hypothetical protein